MKVVFLDIDGVLNSHRTYIAFGGIPRTTARNCRATLDEVAIRLIGGIVHASNAKVVLSSTLRKHSDWLDYGPALDLPIIDRTPSGIGSRGREIADWLAVHPEVKQYAIIDDDSDMLQEQFPFFVHTSYLEGFSFANATKLAELMGINIHDVNDPAQPCKTMELVEAC